MKQWTGADTCGLVIKSYLWLVCATAPATALVVWVVDNVRRGTFLESLGGAAGLFVVFIVVFAVVALGGAVVALPFTHVLGRGLQRVRSDLTHALAHAVLAGALAAITMQALLFAFEDDHWSWQYPLLLAVPAGVAAAIARWRFVIDGPAAVEKPHAAGLVDKSAE
ncbi:hypothetical protein [Curtobacterium sp. ISL-83]|uniref:hypothetical protein n=1 Tax=Curtobacterium sp. ISL-83 TaxID=2819145 RepID=UPI001BEB5059|nr:hypothetical protein [Curtobacterium sp. ISL-83]MBT2501099.1 hypothetical protein [Curtobacterium sp. ISL-83]